MTDDLIKALQKELREADDRITELEARLNWLIFHFDKNPEWKWYGKDVAAAMRQTLEKGDE